MQIRETVLPYQPIQHAKNSGVDYSFRGRVGKNAPYSGRLLYLSTN